MKSEDFGFAVVMLVVLGLAGLLFGTIGCVNERIEFVTSEPRIEQLRMDLAKVTAQRSEDAVGQATQWNQVIASKKRWNSVVFLNLWIPDGWERIKPIEMPE